MLIFSDNLITDVGANMICESFLNLRKLFLNNNKITATGIKNIHKLTNLRCLDLRVNEIRDAGI